MNTFWFRFPQEQTFSTHFFSLDNFCGDTFQQMDDHKNQTQLADHQNQIKSANYKNQTQLADHQNQTQLAHSCNQTQSTNYKNQTQLADSCNQTQSADSCNQLIFAMDANKKSTNIEYIQGMLTREIGLSFRLMPLVLLGRPEKGGTFRCRLASHLT